MRNLFLALIAQTFFFYSCGHKKMVPAINDPIVIDPSIASTGNRTSDSVASETPTIIVNNDFISVLDSDLTLAKLKTMFDETTLSTEVLENSHNSSVKDTIVTYGNGLDSIRFYSGSQKEILLHIKLVSDQIEFANGIRIGEEKDIFRKKFGQKNISDTLKIRDLEGGSVFTFCFKDEKLTQIVFNAEYIE